MMRWRPVLRSTVVWVVTIVMGVRVVNFWGWSALAHSLAETTMVT